MFLRPEFSKYLLRFGREETTRIKCRVPRLLGPLILFLLGTLDPLAMEIVKKILKWIDGELGNFKVVLEKKI